MSDLPAERSALNAMLSALTWTPFCTLRGCSTLLSDSSISDRALSLFGQAAVLDGVLKPLAVKRW